MMNDSSNLVDYFKPVGQCLIFIFLTNQEKRRIPHAKFIIRRFDTHLESKRYKYVFRNVRILRFSRLNYLIRHFHRDLLVQLV